jgi:hypothetical protein
MFDYMRKRFIKAARESTIETFSVAICDCIQLPVTTHMKTRLTVLHYVYRHNK